MSLESPLYILFTTNHYYFFTPMTTASGHNRRPNHDVEIIYGTMLNITGPWWGRLVCRIAASRKSRWPSSDYFLEIVHLPTPEMIYIQLMRVLPRHVSIYFTRWTAFVPQCVNKHHLTDDQPLINHNLSPEATYFSAKSTCNNQPFEVPITTKE